MNVSNSNHKVNFGKREVVNLTLNSWSLNYECLSYRVIICTFAEGAIGGQFDFKMFPRKFSAVG